MHTEKFYIARLKVGLNTLVLIFGRRDKKLSSEIIIKQMCVYMHTQNYDVSWPLLTPIHVENKEFPLKLP